MPARLTASAVDVWLADPGLASPRELEQYHSLLSRDELSRRRRFAFAGDRDLYVISRVLLRTILSTYASVPPADWRFRINPSGRPELDPGMHCDALHFNLSHTSGLVGLAISTTPEIGIDVERLVGAGDIMRIAGEFLSPGEQRSLSGLIDDQHRRLFEFWTLKEAYAKARGEGLGLLFSQIEFSIDQDKPVLMSPGVPDTELSAWHFRVATPTKEHQLALAVRLPSEPCVSVRWWSGVW